MTLTRFYSYNKLVNQVEFPHLKTVQTAKFKVKVTHGHIVALPCVSPCKQAAQCGSE